MPTLQGCWNWFREALFRSFLSPESPDTIAGLHSAVSPGRRPGINTEVAAAHFIIKEIFLHRSTKMPASYTDVETKMQRSRAHHREPSTNLPQFQPQCSALLGAHRSVLSKHLHTPLQIILWHAAELSRCPRRGKGSSDVSTARHRRCSNTPQRIRIKRDQLTRKSEHTNVQRWKSQRAHSTSRPPALSIDNSPNETLTLLSQKTLVHTLTNASPAHRAVFPLLLSQQHQLHSVLIQHCLHGRKQQGWEL